MIIKSQNKKAVVSFMGAGGEPCGHVHPSVPSDRPDIMMMCSVGFFSPELCENKVRFGSGFNHYAKAKQREVEMQMEGFTLSLLLRGDHGLRSTSDTSPRGNSSKLTLTVSNRTLF